MSTLRALARLADNEIRLLHRFAARIGALLDTKQEYSYRPVQAAGSSLTMEDAFER